MLQRQAAAKQEHLPFQYCNWRMRPSQQGKPDDRQQMRGERLYRPFHMQPYYHISSWRCDWLMKCCQYESMALHAGGQSKPKLSSVASACMTRTPCSLCWTKVLAVHSPRPACTLQQSFPVLLPLLTCPNHAQKPQNHRLLGSG